MNIKYKKLSIPTAVATVVLGAVVSVPAQARYQGIEQAEVLRAEPIFESFEVSEPREVCTNERIRVNSRERYDRYDRYDGHQSRRSRTPGVVGAILGGAIGHSVGHGKKNKKIGTAVGAILGGTIGADISRRNHERYQSRLYERGYDRGPDGRYEGVSYRTERVCRVEQDYRTEERISGYDVTYAYGGRTYSTVTRHAPGDYLDVNVQVTPAE